MIRTSQRSRGSAAFFGITIGMVVDVNDPQQMGRIRVMCPALGDRPEQNVTDIQWASYAAPFGGITTGGTRGPEQGTSSGPVAYGMWSIPKVGSYALVMCIDGHPDYRVWIGCLYGTFLPHTMPSGRWVDQESDGPLTSTENPLEPLYTNMRTAFSNSKIPFKDAFEAKTRAVDNQVSAVDVEVLDQVTSSKVDDKFDGTANADGSMKDRGTRRGYQQSRQRPDIKFRSTGGNFDSQVYSVTTPGMHSFTMDDSITNGRIRIRSTSGNQIILDDTNERIYISSSHGNNWFEMDKQGNIDVYSSKRISFHALEGFNFKTEGAFRVDASEIHLNASYNWRATSKIAMDIRADGVMNIHTGGILNLSTSGVTATTGVGKFDLVSSGVEILSSSAINITSSATMDLYSTSAVVTIQGSALALQPGGATTATPSATTAASYAYAPNRVPNKEPWGRVMSINTENPTSFNNPNELEFPDYNDPNIGKIEFGIEVTPKRNIFWRR